MTSKSSNTYCFFLADAQAPAGFPSETKVKRGVCIVHGHKEPTEKLGKDDLAAHEGASPVKAGQRPGVGLSHCRDTECQIVRRLWASIRN